MSRLALVAVVGAGLAFSFARVSRTAGQIAMRREVPRGEVTGLEMAIEGSLRAVPGASVRWWVTLYEVVRGRELRVAPGCEVRALASHAPERPLTTVSTDSAGRAVLVMPMPEALDERPHLVVEATCPRGVRRIFEVDLDLEERDDLALVLDRSSVPPGGSALVIGRVVDRATGRAVAGTNVDVRTSRRGALDREQTVVTDATGLFTLRVSSEPGRVDDLEVHASVRRRAADGTVWTTASRTVTLDVASPPTAPSLFVRASPTVPVVPPGARVEFVVEVRDARGAPVPDATVVGPSREDSSPPGRADDEMPVELRTDAFGVARLFWRIPQGVQAGQFWTESVPITVTSAALGTAQATATVRVARRSSFVSVAVSGGALVPGAPARVLARVLGADGRPLADREVFLEGARVGSGSRGRTDGQGLVAFEVARVAQGPQDDACGGPTASQVQVRVEEEVTSHCLPVDPDAPLAVSAPARVEPGETLTVTLHRTARAQGRDVTIALLRRVANGWEPVAQQFVGPLDHSVSFVPDVSAVGDLWVRARVLLPDGRSVRGSGTLVRIARAVSGLSLSATRRGVEVHGTFPDESLLVLAGTETPDRWIAAFAGESSTETSLSLDGLALEAELALRVPRDTGASAVFRGESIVSQPMPQAPVAVGLLRDPWRTRSRFVRGRLGRLFRAVEAFVESRLPDRLDEVASRGPRGWTWNQEMLAAAIQQAGIDAEGSSALDGEPLDIAALMALEPMFTFDTVARRITRARLYRVTLALRRLTDERDLDLPWARRGDPRTWIATLAETFFEDGSGLDVRELFDGWGRPFVFRPSRRTAFLPALPGWEVASLGPDGRDGTPDDWVDPFARVLPSSSLYAQAVGEDELVARLSGVALGRAWVEELAEHVGEAEDDAMASSADEADHDVLADGWANAPGPLPPPARLGPVASLQSQPGGILPPGASSLAWSELPTERTELTAIAVAVATSGPPRLAVATFTAGGSSIVRAELPEVMRVGDEVTVPVFASALEGAEAPALTLSSSGEGGDAELSVEGKNNGSPIRRGGLRLRAHRAGVIRIHLEARVGDADPSHLEARVRVLPPGSLVAHHESGLLRPGSEFRPARLADAERGVLVSRRVVVVSPRALDRLPWVAELTDGSRSDPREAAVAWARSLRVPLDAEFAARVARGVEGEGPLACACALVALATHPEHGATLERLRSRLALPADIRERAAMLVALGPVAPDVADATSDGIDTLVTSLRADGWRAFADARGSPTVLARYAAALLLLNEDDGPGRALYRQASEALVPNASGERRLLGESGRVGDGWIGTLALAIAARQLGESAVADELAAAALRELYLVRRTGLEGVLWLLAASMYGALGEEGADGARLEVAGSSHVLSADETFQRDIRPDDAISLASARPVVFAMESRTVRLLDARRDAPLDVRIEGLLVDPSRVGSSSARAALELVVEAREVAVAEPVVELELPALAQLDETAREAIARSRSVRGIDGPDRGAVLRLRMGRLEPREAVRIPLVLRWLGAGSARGLGIVAYDAASPTLRTVRPAELVRLGAEGL